MNVQIVVVGGDLLVRAPGVRRNIDREALLAQPAPEECRRRRLVLDDEDLTSFLGRERVPPFGRRRAMR